MSGLLAILLGATAGLGLGWAAWLTANRCAANYDSPDVYADDNARLGTGDPGSIFVGAALVPAVMALWGAYVGWRTIDVAVAACALLVTALLLALSLVDLRVRRLPNPLVLALLGCALLQALWLEQPTLGAAAKGMAVALAVFGLIYLLGRGAMGLGDVKLEAAIGALLGYPAVLAAMFAGIIASGIAAAALLVTRRAGRKDAFAYGPYLALGAWLVYTRVLGLWPG